MGANWPLVLQYFWRDFSAVTSGLRAMFMTHPLEFPGFAGWEASRRPQGALGRKGIVQRVATAVYLLSVQGARFGSVNSKNRF